MPAPFFEILSGTIDGVNDTFTFSKAYTPGTVAIYLNGQLLMMAAANPWTESDPATGEVVVDADVIPVPGDQLAGFALDTSVDSDAVVIEEMQAVVADVNVAVAVIEETSEINAVIEEPSVVAVIESASEVQAVVAVPEGIVAVVEG